MADSNNQFDASRPTAVADNVDERLPSGAAVADTCDKAAYQRPTIVELIRNPAPHRVAEMDPETSDDRRLDAQLLAAVSEAMSGLAHASRNALQRAQACLEMLSFEVKGNPKALNLIARLQAAQDDLHHLYEKVREYAAPLRPDLRSWPVAEAVRDAWRGLESLRSGRDVRLHEDVFVADTVCEIDRPLLVHTFSHMFRNSLAAARDPVEILVTFEEAILADRPALKVSVGDNGPGFAFDARGHAFQPFYKTRARGSGLGLAICKRIIDAHSGKIELEPDAAPGQRAPVHLVGVHSDNPRLAGAHMTIILPRRIR
jgi:signal transduction histidine kinase